MGEFSAVRAQIIAHKVAIGEIKFEDVSPAYKTAVKLILEGKADV